MDACSVVRLVRTGTTRLAKFLEKEVLESSGTQRSRSFDAKIKDDIAMSLQTLLNLKERDVERVVWEEQKLIDERLATCLVPYQVAANIIMRGLPKEVRKKCMEELKAEENFLAEGITCKGDNKFIQWKEQDVFVSTGLNYLRRVSPLRSSRTPVIAVMGHTQHGKTTLLDVLQRTNFRNEESRGTSQTIRAFTIPGSEEIVRSVTFVDTPGQRIFTETRFHAQSIADAILLVVSLVEGVQSQTYETIKVALNLDRPIVVVLNKLDLYSDSQKANEAVFNILMDLREAGVNVVMIHKEKDIERLHVCKSGPKSNTLLSEEAHNTFQLFAPMKKIDPKYKGSSTHPVLNLQRSCTGICISAKKSENINLLWLLIERMSSVLSPVCHSKTEDYTSHSCSHQAVILESSKHLFDEESFRIRKSVQQLQKKQITAFEKRQLQFGKNSVCVRLHSALNAARKKVQSSNPTSTRCLVLTVVVREGCLTRGMPFVADQTKGRVDYMIDSIGNYVNEAYPGTAVTIIDLHSNTGCPGVRTHLLSMPSMEERDRVFEYRRLLQWFVECFPTRLNLLRPRGMDVSFAYLGDYGQLKNTRCLEYQLLYGPPQDASLTELNSESTQHTITMSDSTPREKSIAEYLSEKNLEHEERHNELLLDDGFHGKTFLDDDLAVTLENTWTQLQPHNRPETQAKYDEMIKSSVQIGVLFKVDSWHSARMLYRELTRLGTRKVAFQAVGMRFGELNVDDIMFFGRAMKIAICYRTPVGLSTDLDRYLEINDTWVLQTDDVSEVVLFLKWCAVALHKEYAPDDYGVTGQSHKNYLVLMKDGAGGGLVKKAEPPNNGRRRRLLITPKSSHSNL
ncbi:putative translation initiation factor IF-2 [Trypanosoma rangeli]|uniref:Putative translation initiation factor IF-2 n=1 Tax=Trypanosoma rangeli TaxID=5698 RepID=A0A3R7MK23_TRYRA|nr:putative translation initiation factor IF-2 [Trypanosoma rangeli]RNF07236.1 putative translation initiation factor IF-2 [Trypanosoma rangeli]|eukprot:RNF07236.1 putative translation initiation factor IF-2 [Trypanosoma rangeli]